MHLKLNRPVVVLLWVLIALGVVARLYRFGAVPSSLNRDEAALGYNAFALSTAGVDEWGRSWPLVFESFGDFKLPGYIYALIPFVRFLGTDPWVIRLPSLISGIVLIVLMYLLCGRWNADRLVRLTAAAMVALSPWAIFYSRMAFEANLGLMWLAIALWLLLLPLSGLTLIGAVASYALAGLTYNTPLLLAPVVAVFVLLAAKHKKEGAIEAVAVLVSAGLLTALLVPVLSQKSNITIFSDPTLAAAERSAYAAATSLPGRLWNQRYVYMVRAVGERLAASIAPVFLVFSGGQNPWHSVPGTGHMLLTVYLLGVGSLVVWGGSRKEKRLWWLWGLVFAALLPAAVTVDAPHATRSLLFLWLLPLPTVLGLTPFRRFLRVALVLIMVESGWYLWAYQTRMGGSLGPAWSSGFNQALRITSLTGTPTVIRNASGSDPAADQAYIFVLLYDRVSVRDFVNTVEYGPRDSAGMVRVEHFTHYWFMRDNQASSEPISVIERTEQGVYEVR